MSVKAKVTEDLTFPLSALDRSNIAQGGGKGANLGELLKENFNVPQGFCLGTAAYKAAAEDGDWYGGMAQILERVDWYDPEDIEKKSAQIRALVENQPLEQGLVAQIGKAYEDLGRKAEDSPRPWVAVRSSATAEDLPEASFAGQQETFLNVRGKEELIQAIQQCWGSLWTARAISYRHQQGYPQHEVGLAVVVQLMVEAEIAGVAFGVNPVSGNRNEIYITSSYGLGEVVVAGSVIPDVFVLGKADLKVISKKKGTKEKRLAGGYGPGEKLQNVERERQNDYSLADRQLGELGKLVKQVEAYYGLPQDIEWALKDGQFYVLQARPITTMTDVTDSQAKDKSRETGEESFIHGQLSRMEKTILDDFLEHYPEAPRPLDYGVVVVSYQGVLERFKSWGLKVPQAEEIVRMDSQGRIQLHLPAIKLSPKLLSLPGRLRTLSKQHEFYAHEWQDIEQDVTQKVKEIEVTDWSKRATEDLVQALTETFRLSKQVIERRFFYLMDMNILPGLGLSLCLKLFTSKQERPLAIDVITAGLPYKTAVIDSALNQLALFACQSSQVVRIIMDTLPENYEAVFAALAQFREGEDFLMQCQDFLKEYGYRTEKMYQPFSSASWKEDPGRLIVGLKAAIQDSHLQERSNKEELKKAAHAQWLADFTAQLRGPFKRLFPWSYERARENHLLREDTVFAFEKLFTGGRIVLKEMAIRLTRQDVVACVEDILYLKESEVVGALQQGGDFRGIVEERKKNFAYNQMLWRNTLYRMADQKGEGEILSGLAGSSGQVEGTARIIMGAHEFRKLKKGDILICPYTDPTWTPLFALAGGMVADTGGPLSHAAIVAREYGIPAVLGTKKASQVFKDGDKMWVDGTSGRVRRLD